MLVNFVLRLLPLVVRGRCTILLYLYFSMAVICEQTLSNLRLIFKLRCISFQIGGAVDSEECCTEYGVTLL